MTAWLILTLLTSVAAVLVSAPFIRRFDRDRSDRPGDVAVYRDQLKEVENEAAQGSIDAVQADTARTEIKRRILAADRLDDQSLAGFTGDERRFALVAVAGIVVLGSVGLYAATGRPDLTESAPNASGFRTMGEPPMEPSAPVQRFIAPSRSEPPASRSPASTQAGVPPVDEMIQRLITRLQRNPQDPEGWRTLGWSYFATEHFTEAAGAYARAIELRPKLAEYRSARGEALIRAANGLVTAEARGVLDEALALDPRDIRARFFIGLAKEQAGDKGAAFEDWSSVLADANPTEPLLPEIKQRVADLGKEVGGAEAGSGETPAPAKIGMLDTLKAMEKSAPAAAPSRGPRPQDIRNAETMAPGDRTAMIRGMVEGLASRLDQSPYDADGWIKLIRSRVVLGESDLAKQSLQRALAVFADDDAERSRIGAAAQQLGLMP